jgi:hypothetical protein
MTKSLNQRLDDLANSTGVSKLVAYQPRRRPLRGLAILSLLLGATGLIIGLIGTDWYWTAEALMMVGFFLSGWLPLFGPVKPWASMRERVDEYDEAVRSRAYLVALPAILIAGAFGLFALPTLAALQHRNPWETIALCGLGAFYLLLLWNAIPTLHASLQLPPAEDDEI